MRLLRQLEFAFGSTAVAGIVDSGRVNAPEISGVNAPGYNDLPSHFDLQQKARELLRLLGASRIASELRVEWNSRLKTAAGRADYRRKLISLNPRLVAHSEEIDRTLRHELAHFLAQFRAGRRRISPHGREWRQACVDVGIPGERRCHTLPFPAKRLLPRFIYRCPNCRRQFPRFRKIRHAVACLACCRQHNGGTFDARFQLKLLRV